MFVIFTGPLNAHAKLATRTKMPKSFESYEDAREFLVKHLKRDFPKHDYDADSEIWWARKETAGPATGFSIEQA